MICTECGSSDWIAVAPGTAADATPFPWPENVRPIRLGEEIPTRAWCLPCLVRLGRATQKEVCHA